MITKIDAIDDDRRDPLFVSYAQNFEDVMLWRALGHIEKGRYVDIGAQDPVVDSVSRAFYERGWRGVHVEPVARYARMLRESRPDEVVIQAAADSKAGSLKFFEIPDTGLSTADAKTAERHARAGYEVREALVPSVTLDAVLEQSGAEVHWLKIDVEGLERRVLAGWRTSAVRPWIVVVESTQPMMTTPSHRSWERLLLAKAYRFVHFDGLNRFYVSTAHLELMPTFTSGPNVFDGFALSGTASSAFAAVLNERLRSLQAGREEFEATHCEALVALERKFVSKLDDAQQVALRMSQAAAERERGLAGKLHDAQQVALRMSQTAAERAQKLSDALNASQSEVLKQIETLAARERDFGAQIQEGQQQQRAIAKAAAKEHQELNAQLHQAREAVAENSRAAAERERGLAGKLHDAQQVVLRMSQTAAERAQKLSDALNALQSEVLKQMETLAARERDFGAQIQEGQQQQRAIAKAAAKEHQELNAQLHQAREAVAENSHAAAQRERGLHEALETKAQLALHQAIALAAIEHELTQLQQTLNQRDKALAAHRTSLEAARQFTDALKRILPGRPEPDPVSNINAPGAISRSTGLSLTQLLTLHGENFLSHAYATLLRRAPDQGGLENYLSELRNGISRIEIIRRIRYSPEGRKSAVAMRGLRLRLFMAALLRLPAIGRPLHTLGSFVGLPDAQEARAYESYLIAELENARLEQNAVQATMAGIAESISEFQSNISATLALQHDPVPGRAVAAVARVHTVSSPRKSPNRCGERHIYYFVDHTIRCPVNTGMQRVTRQLARALLALGEHIEFVKWDQDLQQFARVNRDELTHLCQWNGPRLSTAELERYQAAGAPPVPIPMHSRGLPHWLVVPEVTHITYQPAPVTLPAIMEARRRGLKTAFVFYDAIPLRRRELASMASNHAAYMQHLLLADLVIPISKWSECDLVTYFVEHERATPASGPRVSTLPLPGEVQLSERNVSTEQRSAIRTLILSVGSIEPRKNQLALIHAFDRYCRDHPDTTWELALAGNLHPDVADQVLTVTRRNRKVQYLDHVPDEELSRLYQTCAFTVFPSVEEGYGLPILESLWHSKPCITADFGSMAEVAEGGGCLTVDTRDPEKLLVCLSRMIDEPGLLERLSREAAERPVATWSDYAKRFAGLLDEESDPLRRLGTVYYWIDHSSTHPGNSGIQRVARMLSRALMALGVRLIPVKWDQVKHRLYSPSSEELAHFSRWNGPLPSAWSQWLAPEEASPHGWLLIPELTTYLNPTSLVDVRSFAIDYGLRTAIIFYDAIPWKMKDAYPPEATHAHKLYMEHLNLFEKVFPISNVSKGDLTEFLTTTRARTPNLDSRIKTCTLPGEFLESTRVGEIKDTRARTIKILSVGTVEPRKNHLTLLQAFARLTQTAQRPVELVIVGSAPYGDLETKVQQIVSSTPGIRWERQVDDARLRTLYAECDFTVYPSLEEGFGLPILESVWNARPCICRNSGAMAEAADGGGCLTVDTGDPVALAEAMLRLVEDNALRYELARAAVRRPIKTWRDYAWEIGADLATERRLAELEAQWATHRTGDFYDQAVNLHRRPILSVCITTYNRAAWLAVSLKNLFREIPAPQEDIELVVCDNTSTDDTSQVVQPYLARPDFKYYRNSINVGMLGNLRVTAHHARGQYIWILGDDDLIRPGSVQRVLAAIRGNPGVALVYLNYAYTREADAQAITDLDAFLTNATPIVAPGPDIAGPIHRISAASENFFTAIYCLVFRRDHALRAYSQNTDGRPFSTMLTCIPTTHYALNYMMTEPGYWIGEPQLVVNMNVSWVRYAPLWVLERIPEVYDLAEKMGADASAVDRWRVNNLPGVTHFFTELYAGDPEGNAAFFSPGRLVSRLKHLAEFRKIVPALGQVYDAAHRDGRPGAEIPAARLFAARTPD